MDMGSAPIKDPTMVKSTRSVRSESPEFNEHGSSDSDVNHPKELRRKTVKAPRPILAILII